MKRLIVAFIGLSLLACKKENADTPDGTTGFVGQWKMRAVSFDPGDGSREFASVDSRKTMRFEANGKVFCNGEICDLDTAASNPSEGTYKLSDSTISAPNCEVTTFPIRLELRTDTLDIYYPCIEGCIARYIRL